MQDFRHLIFQQSFSYFLQNEFVGGAVETLHSKYIATYFGAVTKNLWIGGGSLKCCGVQQRFTQSRPPIKDFLLQ